MKLFPEVSLKIHLPDIVTLRILVEKMCRGRFFTEVLLNIMWKYCSQILGERLPIGILVERFCPQEPPYRVRRLGISGSRFAKK